MKKLLIAAVLALGIVPFSTSAMAEGEVGDTWTIGNYCLGDSLEMIREFTNAIVRGGLPVYKQIVNDPASPCTDIRSDPRLKPVQVTLIKEMWAFVLPGGEELVMWEIVDKSGQKGYTWLRPTGEGA